MVISLAQFFYQKWNFRNCFGAKDGKHVRIQNPAHASSLYHNYKQYFSIIFLGVADSGCKFLCVDIGACGRQSDGGAFHNSDVYKCLHNNTFNCQLLSKLPKSEKNNTLCVAYGEAYPLMPKLMWSFRRQNLHADKKIFN